MKKQLQAEAHILDRIMYLLEEGSVTYTMSQDDDFAKYIDKLYFSLHTKASNIRECTIEYKANHRLARVLA